MVGRPVRKQGGKARVGIACSRQQRRTPAEAPSVRLNHGLTAPKRTDVGEQRVRRGRRPSSRLGRSPSAVPHVVLQPRLLRESVRRTSDALDHLRHAIEMSEEFRDSAKDDSDLDPIRDEPAFKQLVSG